MVEPRKFSNTTEAYMTGYHEGTEATHGRYIEAIGAMEPRRDSPMPSLELPPCYALKRIGELLVCVHLDSPGSRDMHADNWKAQISNDAEAQALGYMLEKYYGKGD